MQVTGQLHAPAALPRGKSLRYPLDGRLAELQIRSGRGGDKKNYLSLPRIEGQSPSP
jgi:hypothetical protein